MIKLQYDLTKTRFGDLVDYDTFVLKERICVKIPECNIEDEPRNAFCLYAPIELESQFGFYEKEDYIQKRNVIIRLDL